jgi:ribose transport system substrate-binding protein
MGGKDSMSIRVRRAARATRFHRPLVAATIAGALAVVAGCGGSASSSGSTPGDAAGLSRATAAVHDATQPNQGFQAPGAAFDATTLRGKKIWVITFLSVPFAQQNVAGLKEAAAAVGATVTAVDGTKGVDAYQRGIRQAIAQGADAIVVGTLNPALFSTDLNAARARGIKVIAVSSHAPGQLPLASEPVDGYVDPCYECAGRLMADSAIAESQGKANALVLWSSDVQIPGQTQLSAIQDEFKKNCPTCTLKVEDVPSTQWSTRLQSVTQIDITSNLKLTYLLPLYDGMVSFMLPAVRAANATKRVKISSFNATPAVMQQIGQGGVLSDVGIGSVRYGWGWADQTFRALAGSAPVKDEQLPVRLFDGSNIGQLKLNASTDTWYGTVDYRSEYRKLWGVTP